MPLQQDKYMICLGASTKSRQEEIILAESTKKVSAQSAPENFKQTDKYDRVKAKGKRE